jgi:3-phenylpropionate/trans-cinnamate dioxygenase ferredoxin reductase component
LSVATVPKTVAIVGAGQAGLQVAASLREQHFEGRIVLIGDEPHAPYQRPPLSKAFLLGEVNASQLSLRPMAYFAQQRIELITGKRAVAIDRLGRVVELADHSQIEYDHLVLATGARNRWLRVPGADQGNVFFLRALEEASALRDKLATAKRAVVIGAGFIGLELAAAAAKRGLHVTVLDVAERPMSRAVSKTMSAIVAREHEKLGVRLLLNTQVAGFQSQAGSVIGVETVEGRVLPADLVAIGIGVVPNVELAAACNLALQDGIVVDELLQTGDPNISAIGDVATHSNLYASGQQIRLESVQNAADQARCVAARLVGKPAPYRALPWFWSHQGALKLQMAGLPGSACQEAVRGDASTDSCSVFLFDQGRLVCVESLNRPAEHMLARRILSSRVIVTPQQASDLSFDLKSLVSVAPVS